MESGKIDSVFSDFFSLFTSLYFESIYFLLALKELCREVKSLNKLMQTCLN